MAADGRGARRAARGAARGTGWTLGGLAAAVLIAAGVPLVWVWIASQVAGTRRDLTPSLAILITTGILVSYWVALVAGSWLRGRSISAEEQQARRRRMSWNRSFRDEAHRPGEDETDWIERIFVI